MPDSQRFILDLDEESGTERDAEQGGAHDEIDRLRRLLADKERLLTEERVEKEENERLLTEERAEKEEKERLLTASEAEKERLLVEKEQLEQEKAQLEEQLRAGTDTNGARGRSQFPTFDPRQASNID